MIDLHTHILPGMDDGAGDVEISLAMLRAQWEQGVTGVALTPHFYREEERPERFFVRRREAWRRLLERVGEDQEHIPDLVLGAEVSWVPGLNRWEELSPFCLGNSRYFLLELPDAPWRSGMLDEIYDLAGGDYIPVIAHLDRYFHTQKADHLEQLFRMGIPLQISAAPMTRWLERSKLGRRIRSSGTCLLISDCHNMTDRPPNLKRGMDGVVKSLGEEYARRMKENSRRIFECAAERGEG